MGSRQGGDPVGAGGQPLARTSLGSGLWLGLGLMLLACSDAIRRITTGPLWRWLLHAQIVIVPLALLFSGTFDNLSLLKEYTNRGMFSMPRWCNI